MSIWSDLDLIYLWVIIWTALICSCPTFFIVCVPLSNLTQRCVYNFEGPLPVHVSVAGKPPLLFHNEGDHRRSVFVYRLYWDVKNLSDNPVSHIKILTTESLPSFVTRHTDRRHHCWWISAVLGKNWLLLADKMFKKKQGKLICFSCHKVQGNQIVSHQSFYYMH